MALCALREVDVLPRGHLLVLGLGTRAIPAAASGGDEEEREQPAGGREAVAPKAGGERPSGQAR